MSVAKLLCPRRQIRHVCPHKSIGFLLMVGVINLVQYKQLKYYLVVSK